MLDIVAIDIAYTAVKVNLYLNTLYFMISFVLFLQLSRCYSTDRFHISGIKESNNKKKWLLLTILGIFFVHVETATCSELHTDLIDTDRLTGLPQVIRAHVRFLQERLLFALFTVFLNAVTKPGPSAPLHRHTHTHTSISCFSFTCCCFTLIKPRYLHLNHAICALASNLPQSSHLWTSW